MSHPPHFGGKFEYELDHKLEFRMDLLGFADFRRLTGCDNVRVRLMEAAHVISPARTQTGWRVFTQADVEAARAWMAENARPQERA
jgi:hypothetical protein